MSRGPGMLGLAQEDPEFVGLFSSVTDYLLRSPATETMRLTQAQREDLFSYASEVNGCDFCTDAHACVVTIMDPDLDPDGKHAALRAVVRHASVEVRPVDEAAARAAGATPEEIRHAVYIAAWAKFSNTLVEVLNPGSPGRDALMEPIKLLAEVGYVATVDMLRDGAAGPPV